MKWNQYSERQKASKQRINENFTTPHQLDRKVRMDRLRTTYVFWDVTPCSQKAFRRNMSPPIQGRIISQVLKLREDMWRVDAHKSPCLTN
jgi:hypothetical protein